MQPLPVVILVEDDPLLLRVYARFLRSPQYELKLTSNPRQALAEAQLVGDRLKLLITDQNLNGLGEALADDLCGRLPDLQVIIVSGDTKPHDRYDTISKPFNLDDFRTRVLEKLGLT